MTIKRILTNKYMLLMVILLILISVDVVWHKGISRVLLPKHFPAAPRSYQTRSCSQPLLSKNKEWRKAVNDLDAMQNLPNDLAGFEMDVYFDTGRNSLLVYHDSAVYSTLQAEQILELYFSKKMQAAIWLDFKNLTEKNRLQSLQHICKLREKFQLKNKMIIESSSLSSLTSYCDSGFFTSYYTPFFNPYRLNEKEIINWVDSVGRGLEKYPVSAISGYYFQYPVLKNYFPSYPILTWTDKPGLSLVGNKFKSQLLNDSSVRVILYPR